MSPYPGRYPGSVGERVIIKSKVKELCFCHTSKESTTSPRRSPCIHSVCNGFYSVSRVCDSEVHTIRSECCKSSFIVCRRGDISESCDSDFSTHDFISPVGYRGNRRGPRNYHGQASILTVPGARRCLDNSSGVYHDVRCHARTYRERSSSVLTLHRPDTISSRTDGDLECWVSGETIYLQVVGPIRV